jgi:DNA-binding HxlR family transcriptional regulator
MPLKKKYHCPVEATIDVVGGKWKPLILWVLRGGTLRYSQIEDELPDITQKMLAKQLRELEKDGIVARKVYPQVPPKVEYSLTETGQSLMPIIDLLNDWGEEHMGDDIEFEYCGEECAEYGPKTPVAKDVIKTHT